jgi:hypothetical protein
MEMIEDEMNELAKYSETRAMLLIAILKVNEINKKHIENYNKYINDFDVSVLLKRETVEMEDDEEFKNDKLYQYALLSSRIVNKIAIHEKVEIADIDNFNKLIKSLSSFEKILLHNDMAHFAK